MTRRLSQPLKKVPDILATIAATSAKPLELWFQDEARIGQKTKVPRRWAAPGTAAGLVLPSCNPEAMTLPLQEIALAVAPGPHAVLFVDEAGWHVTGWP